MKILLERLRLLPLAMVISYGSAKDATAQSSPDAQKVRPLLEKYCFECHGEKKQKGELRLDRLKSKISTLDQLERWVDVGDQLKAGEMPPAKAKQRPTVAELATLIEGVSAKVRLSADKMKRPGRLQVRRLTREQYNATLQDLLGLPLNFAKELPAEGLSENGFSNDADFLNLSPLYLEFFLKNAQHAMNKALVDGPRPDDGYHFTLKMAPLSKATREQTVSHAWNLYSDGKTRVGKPPKGEKWPPVAGKYMNFQWKPHPKAKKRQELMTFKDGMQLAPHAKLHYGQLKSIWGRLSLPGDKNRNAFPTEGWLRVRIRAGSVPATAGSAPPSLQVMLNYDVLHGKTLNDLGTQQITAPMDQPGTYDFIVRLENLNLPSQNNEKGPPYFEIWNPRWVPVMKDKLQPEVADELGLAKAYVESVQVDWPYVPAWPPESHIAILPAELGDDEKAIALRELTRFMRRAHRRPVDKKQIEEMLALYERDRADGRSFIEAMRTALAAVLCSPGFLYVDQSATDDGKLTPHALASRLSYFLWNSMPDEHLLSLADSAKLGHPAMLEAEADRMLLDPRARRFVEQFAAEWLDLASFENVAINMDLFREFRFETKDLLREETIAFVAEVFDRDLSVLNFIDSDFVMMNNRLAMHYGMDDVYDNVFHSIPAGAHRGGLLTQGSILAATGTGEQSHPFRRGSWVLTRLLGTPPPSPPVVIPELAAAKPEEVPKSLKAQLEIHRNQATCAACHDKLDPWGLALEHYDAIGQWRDIYKPGNKARVEASATLPDGTEINGVEDLKRIILEDKRELFLENYARKMLGYALARSLDATDQPAVEELAQSLAKNDFRSRQFILSLVKHPAFLKP